MNIFIDIETIPDQTPGAVDLIKSELTVKAPDLTKPKLIDALDLGSDGKFKTVPELKELWIEKFGDEAKEQQAKEKWLKTSFDGAKGQICCICASTGGKIASFTGGEKTILTSLNQWLIEKYSFDQYQPDVTFIAHNKAFDLPFMHKRFIINKIKPEFKFKPHARHPVNFCTMEEWSGFNGKVSLDNLCGYLGVKGKLEGMDGSKVWPEYQQGNIDKITEYCIDDVRCLIDVYNRLTFNY